jgi:hypothetical protein
VAVAKELLTIFCIIGFPDFLQSDNGSEFVNSVLKELLQMVPGVVMINGRPRHPESQGSVERSNQDIKPMLNHWIKKNNSTNWSLGIHVVQSIKNARWHIGVNNVPYTLVYGMCMRRGLASAHIPKRLLNSSCNEEELKLALAKLEIEDGVTTESVEFLHDSRADRPEDVIPFPDEIPNEGFIRHDVNGFGNCLPLSIMAGMHRIQEPDAPLLMDYGDTQVGELRKQVFKHLICDVFKKTNYREMENILDEKIDKGKLMMSLPSFMDGVHFPEGDITVGQAMELIRPEIEGNNIWLDVNHCKYFSKIFQVNIMVWKPKQRCGYEPVNILRPAYFGAEENMGTVHILYSPSNPGPVPAAPYEEWTDAAFGSPIHFSLLLPTDEMFFTKKVLLESATNSVSPVSDVAIKLRTFAAVDEILLSPAPPHSSLDEGLKCRECLESCSADHSCGCCHKYIHAICGVDFIVDGAPEEGYGCRRTCSQCLEVGADVKLGDIVSPHRKKLRADAHTSLLCQAARMQRNFRKRAPEPGPLEPGSIVNLRIPSVDRGKVDSNNIAGVVLERTPANKYRIGFPNGVLETCMPRSELRSQPKQTLGLFPGLSEVMSSWQTSPKITIRGAANAASATGGQGYLHCTCKSKCDAQKCGCKRSSMPCNSRCHPRNQQCCNR